MSILSIKSIQQYHIQDKKIISLKWVYSFKNIDVVVKARLVAKGLIYNKEILKDSPTFKEALRIILPLIAQTKNEN